MPRLHPETPRDVIRKLRRLGFEGPIGGGKHAVMRHPDTHLKLPIPVHGNRDLPVGTLRAIIRELGVDVSVWTEL